MAYSTTKFYRSICYSEITFKIGEQLAKLHAKCLVVVCAQFHLSLSRLKIQNVPDNLCMSHWLTELRQWPTVDHVRRFTAASFSLLLQLCVRLVVEFVIWLLWTCYCQWINMLFHRTSVLFNNFRVFQFCMALSFTLSMAFWTQVFLKVVYRHVSGAWWNICIPFYCKFTNEFEMERIHKIG